MKKFKFISVVALIFMSSVFMFSGCKKTLLMDEHKCAEVALEYMENKYQEEFEVLDSGEVGGVFGKSGYATVNLKNSSDDTEKVYIVVIYPNTIDDKNNDGYYDSYKVISDTYMSEIVNQYARKKVEKLLIEAELERFITRINIEEIAKIKGFWGFSADFPLIEEKEFSLEQLLDNYCIDINCSLEVPESEIGDTLQDNIINQFEPLISNDTIGFKIEIYLEEVYVEREELYKKNETLFRNDRKNRLQGIDRISFNIGEEKA
ncbi:MAG: hypothetical protein IJA34_14425 [Lachnospiraceae bacterium]|nr:hypothetical protein [Lachnospiraceae bacterium]